MLREGLAVRACHAGRSPGRRAPGPLFPLPVPCSQGRDASPGRRANQLAALSGRGPARSARRRDS
jgi:hypothetical protein